MKRFLHKATGSVFKRKPRKKRTLRMDTTAPSPDAPAPGAANTSLPQEENRPGPSMNEITPAVTREVDPTTTHPAGSPSVFIEGSDPPTAVPPQGDAHLIAPIQESTVMVSPPLDIGSPTSITDNPSHTTALSGEETPSNATRKDKPSLFERAVDPFLYCLDVAEKALDIPGIPLAKSVTMKSNQNDFKALADEIGTLTKKISAHLEQDASSPSGELPKALEEAIKDLIRPMTSFCDKIKDLQDRNVFVAYFQAEKDKEDLTQLKEEVDVAKQDFQVGSLIRIERHQLQIERERAKDKYHNLVNNLPRATAASWDSGRNTTRHQSCLQGTREGVLKIINEWVYNDKPDTPTVFWLHGLAGIGKSTIARTVAETAAEKGILGGSFFFDRHDEKLRDANLVIPSIVHQLAHHIDYNFMAHIGKALEENPDLGTKALSIQFKKLFAEPLKESNRKPTVLLLVLDALDEASPNPVVSQVLQLLLTTNVPIAVRVFLTSRPEKHIRSVFESDKHHLKLVLHLHVEDHIIQHDIRLFLETRLRLIPTELQVDLPDWPSHADMDALVSMAGKLFIFAATVARYIANDYICDPDRQLKMLLDLRSRSGLTAYAELDNLYMHVLSSAVTGAGDDTQFTSDLQSILGAIVSLQDPLPVTALSALIHQAPQKLSLLFIMFILSFLLPLPSMISPRPTIFPFQTLSQIPQDVLMEDSVLMFRVKSLLCFFNVWR
ncbi:hypothetical protein NLI96_g9387 [Meripilus lineatus]|uniref:NACHT domain-containing protein n=1 Tax=Meripilus lineatus TaxID=2056292 RepID=A0AAD5UX96_9APHY|nr:hypothetical protein NLI96_g9387 [Physisporinus lineatus]